MNSSFCVKEHWCGTPYDIGVPQYLNYSISTSEQPTSKKSSNNEEYKLLVEPTLFARRLDQSTGTISNQIERLSVEPHLLLISCDTLTPQFLAREDKLREKRLLKQQQENNKPSDAGETSVNQEVKPDSEDTSSTDSTTSSSTTLKRKRLHGKSEPVKKLKVSNPVAPPQPVIKSQPPPQQQQQQPPPVSNIQFIQPQQLSQETQQLRLPIISKPDSVLVRLSSGQVVLVPRKLLKKVNPPAPQSVAAGPVAVTGAAQNSAPPWQGAPVKDQRQAGLPNGISDLPVNVTLAQALDMLGKKYSTPDGQKTEQHPFPSPNTAQMPNSILKQLADNSNQNGRTFRYVKIRAYQGPPQSQTTSTSPSPQVATTPATSSLSQQLVKIQQLPVNPLPRHAVTAQRSVPLPSAPFNVTRIVQQQQPQPGRRTVMLTSPVTRPQFMTTNGGLSSPFHQGGQNPMKICIIHSPRKADGTPVSPGSATPGILVMNPPSNLRQINFNEVLKAISLQNAATTQAQLQSQAMSQNNATSHVISPTPVQRSNVAIVNGNTATSTMTVPQKLLPLPTDTNGLVQSRVS